MDKIISFKEAKSCPTQFVLAVNDTLNAISGKWKLPIIGSLLFGKKRFTEIQRNIPKITPRMLSKELKDLEMNGLLRGKFMIAHPFQSNMNLLIQRNP